MQTKHRLRFENFDSLPRAVRDALNECVWPLASQYHKDVWLAKAPAAIMVDRIKRADSLFCTGDNRLPPMPGRAGEVLAILHGERG